MAQQYDAVVVGGGPAGASCAVWLARLGLSPLLIESAEGLGGLARSNPFQDNWIAVLPGLTGREVGANIAHSVSLANVPVLTSTRVQHFQKRDAGFVTTFQGVEAGEVTSRTIVIASGTCARPLPGQAPGEHFRGVLVGPGMHVAEQDYRGKSVAVLGGGDNAFENYAFVRDRGAAQVHVYARSVRAQAQWFERARTADVHLGPYAVEPTQRRVNGRQYDLILVFYGWEPRAPFADALMLERDASGYFKTDFHTAQTSVDGVYAIGEVAHRMHPCVVTAMADGVVAAKAIQARLETRQAR